MAVYVGARDLFRQMVDPGHTTYGTLLIEEAVAVVQILDNQGVIVEMLQQVLDNQGVEMADFTVLESEMDALGTTADEAVTLLNELKGMEGSVEDPSVQEKIDALATKLTGIQGSLSTAVETDTPPSDTAPVVPTPDPVPAPVPSEPTVPAEPTDPGVTPDPTEPAPPVVAPTDGGDGDGTVDQTPSA